MQETNSNQNAWYEKTWLVVILCAFIFPVGLYALWKNSTISNLWKIIWTVFILTIVIAVISDDKKKIKTEEKQPLQTTTESQTIEAPQVNSAEVEKANAEREAIVEKLKKRAARDWPNDYSTQEFWINQELEDYEYMLQIEDNAIKRQAQRDWPLDFSTQKFWYNEQIEAKERLSR